MAPRNLLLCFDAFGTLFKPRQAIEKQYGEVARSFGLTGFSDEDVKGSFRTAMKHESKINPNYGRANGLNAEIWWTNIITNTFRSFIGPEMQLPSGLVPRLLHRFWCDEGYTFFPDVLPLIQQLRQMHMSNNTHVVIGVITNSDDRVPDILSSLGMRVSPLRYGGDPKQHFDASAQYDIDFSIMSYDVGHEKPDKRIFQAAEETLNTVLEAGFLGTAPRTDLHQWRKVYIGDEFEKDVVGAQNAGWDAVLIDRESPEQHQGVLWPDQQANKSLTEAFQSGKPVGFGSLAELTKLLPS